MFRIFVGIFALAVFVETVFVETLAAEDLSKYSFPIRNVVAPLDDGDDPRASFRREPDSLPIQVGPFVEHRRRCIFCLRRF